ncbi:hypothetical protein LCGC14_1680880 [marine sediment metagenome]|uniref:Uncharacterized protein n=1 Tax=marine sediment metagenome TaxID=412755 RepID=A0A0F9IB14_9ZZZZ
MIMKDVADLILNTIIMGHAKEKGGFEMYTVVDRVDGKWVGLCVIQDGVERSVRDTREAAIQWVIDSAKGLNHVDIAEANIRFGYEEEEKAERKDVRVQSFRDALETIANMPYACSDAKRVAQEALKENEE